MFKIIKTLSKNKVNVGDEFVLDFSNRIVTNISKANVKFDNGQKYPTKQINAWIRLEYNKQQQIKVFDSRKIQFKRFMDELRKDLEPSSDKPNTLCSYILYTNLTTNVTTFLFGKYAYVTNVDMIEKINSPKNIICSGYYVTERWPNSNDQTIVSIYPHIINDINNRVLNKHIETWNRNNLSHQLKLHKNFQTLKSLPF
jgi:hypothetical protein